MTKKPAHRPRLFIGPTESRVLEMPSEMWRGIDKVAEAAKISAQEVIRRLLNGNKVLNSVPPSRDELVQKVVLAMRECGVDVYMRKSKKEKASE